MHLYDDLITIFNECFGIDYSTRLIKGGDEPIYIPANEHQNYHALYFAHGFFSSALHECAHWLIAGEARRMLVDFGYWYAPDGRTPEQQAVFQAVEVKPQALEWILSKAAGHKFCVSIDNLNGKESDTQAFKQAVYEQVIHYCLTGLPTRAQRLRDALSAFYSQGSTLSPNDFSLAELGLTN